MWPSALVYASLALGSFESDVCGKTELHCTQNASCCLDKPMCEGDCAECCIDQSTICVEPREGFQTSTCCARWTVGCSVGTVGCCDPARPYQFLPGAADDAAYGAANRTRSVRRSPQRLARDPATAVAIAAAVAPASSRRLSNDAPKGTAYAMFTQAATDGLAVATINLADGSVQSKRSVQGPAASNYGLFSGESTRVYPFTGTSFAYVDADEPKKPDSTSLTVYSIDPQTGASESRPVRGCVGYPLGIEWDGVARKLVAGTHASDGSTASFCSVDVATGAGTPLGKLDRGSSEASASYYAGYFSHASNGLVHRVGALRVSEGGGAGVGTTDTSGSKPTSWQPVVAPAAGHGTPVTLHEHPSGDGSYLSLAPRSDSSSLDVVHWAMDGSVGSVVAKLANAKHPTLPWGQGMLGYVSSAVGGGVFAALTVARHPSVFGGKDRWTLSVVDFASGSLVESELSPAPASGGAESAALAGFGLASA